jgi:hypothetical protein
MDLKNNRMFFIHFLFLPREIPHSSPHGKSNIEGKQNEMTTAERTE